MLTCAQTVQETSFNHLFLFNETKKQIADLWYQEFSFKCDRQYDTMVTVIQ